jgi:hypothetical protein
MFLFCSYRVKSQCGLSCGSAISGWFADGSAPIYHDAAYVLQIALIMIMALLANGAMHVESRTTYPEN